MYGSDIKADEVPRKSVIIWLNDPSNLKYFSVCIYANGRGITAVYVIFDVWTPNSLRSLD